MQTFLPSSRVQWVNVQDLLSPASRSLIYTQERIGRLQLAAILVYFPKQAKWWYWFRDNKTRYDAVQCLYNQAKYRKLTVDSLAGTAIINQDGALLQVVTSCASDLQWAPYISGVRTSVIRPCKKVKPNMAEIEGAIVRRFQTPAQKFHWMAYPYFRAGDWNWRTIRTPYAFLRLQIPPSLASLSATKFLLQIYMELTDDLLLAEQCTGKGWVRFLSEASYICRIFRNYPGLGLGNVYSFWITIHYIIQSTLHWAFQWPITSSILLIYIMYLAYIIYFYNNCLS